MRNFLRKGNVPNGQGGKYVGNTKKRRGFKKT